MRYTWILFVAFLISCNNNKPKTAEGPPVASPDAESGIPADTVNKKQADTVAVPLSISPIPVTGNLGQITFSWNDSTLFYFDQVKHEGSIRLNGKDYSFTRCS